MTERQLDILRIYYEHLRTMDGFWRIYFKKSTDD